MSRSMQSVNCEEIHRGRFLTNTAFKASTDQLFTERMVKKLNFHD